MLQWHIPEGWEIVSPGELRVDGENPNRMKKTLQGALLLSLQTDGWLKPIVTDMNGTIADGEHRWNLAKENGQTTVPIRRAEVNDAQRRILRQVLNRLQGTDDPLALALQYRTIVKAGLQTDLIKRLILSETELRKALESPPKEEDEYKIPALEQVETDIELGDRYQLGDHILLCGDSTKLEYFETLMQGTKADCIFTDPPYNINMATIKHPKFKQRPMIGDSQTKTEYAKFCDDFIKNLIQHSKGDIYICHAPKEDGQILVQKLLENDIHWSSEIIWAKQAFTLGRSNYHSRYEPIFYGWIEKSSYVGGRKEDNVWNIKRPTKSPLHPTMKPVELCAKGITNSTMPGMVVLDVFGGSGSTLIACEQTSRKCHMIEIDPRYCHIIIDRWEAYTGQEAKKL